MSDLSTFTKHVQEVLSDTFRDLHWTPEDAAKYMAEVGTRRRAFEELADHLNEMIVKPRMETVVKLFPNAKMSEEQQSHWSCCTFEYCDRFPALTSVEISLEHDVRFEKLIVHSRIRIMPIFVRFNEQDNLPLRLDCVSEVEVADWVEERLLEFLDTYLRIETDAGSSANRLVTDPVCGMQIGHLSAAGSHSYCGHPYYFCSQECLAKFQDDPTQYVQIKMM